MSLGPIGQIIKRKLEENFLSDKIEVTDESARHAGHSGSRPEGETHFAVKVVSDKFTGISLVKQHGMINETLASELKTRVHALRISTSTP